jgi:hypothetical protein
MSPRATTTAAPVPPARIRPSEVIDVLCVHPTFPATAEVIMPWLPAGYDQRLKGRVFATAPGSYFQGGPPQKFLRPEATPPDGGVPGSDPEFMKKDLLDRWEISGAILTPHANKINSWRDVNWAGCRRSRQSHVRGPVPVNRQAVSP